MNLRGYKHLRNRVRTVEDFKILAKWCQQRVDLCRKKEIDCETELKAYYGRFLAVAAPKYPPGDQTLKALMAHCRELSEHRSKLVNRYADRAIELEAAPAPK